jgi:hypothetical protein
LAAAALDAAGASLAWRDLTPESLLISRPPEDEERGLRRTVDRVVDGSLLARSPAQLRLERTALPAFAALIVLESEPPLAMRPHNEVLEIVARVAGSLASGQTWLRQSPVGTGVDGGTGSVSATLLAAASPDRNENAGQHPDAILAAQTAGDSRPRGVTQHGGLLFLLNVIGELEIPRRLADDLPDRTYRWALHRLALALLTHADDNDAAVLAFAGLRPDSPPPGRDADPPTDGERQALTAVAREIQTELQRRLSHLDLPADEPLLFVTERTARIVADPGWIEAHFSIGDVSTDLRRAALDIDPGYVAWLGVVVRFIYE